METHLEKNSKVFMFGSREETRMILLIFFGLFIGSLVLGFLEQGVTNFMWVIWLMCVFLLGLYFISRYRRGVIIAGDTVTFYRRILPNKSFLISDITRITQRTYRMGNHGDILHFVIVGYLSKNKKPRTVGFELSNISKGDFVEIIGLITTMNNKVLVDRGVRYWYEKWNVH